MRDGVELYAAIYLPKDSSQPHPILLDRTPDRARYCNEEPRDLVGRRRSSCRRTRSVAYEDVAAATSGGVFNDMRRTLM
jgi:predicted acyl esterase